MFRDNITRGLEYHGEILVDYSKLVLFKYDHIQVIDMKSIKEMVIVIMSGFNNDDLRVYSVVKGKQIRLQNQFKIGIDKENSQIGIIDENTVAVTAPFISCIHIVDLTSEIITRIACTTRITGAIAVIDKYLFVACSETIVKMNLQGAVIFSLSPHPNIQFLHPVGQALYCVNGLQNFVTHIDMANKNEDRLLDFPFHPVSLTSDDCGNIYFICNNVVWKAAHDGTDPKVVLTKKHNSFNPRRICFDISNNLLLVLANDRKIIIYRKF